MDRVNGIGPLASRGGVEVTPVLTSKGASVDSHKGLLFESRLTGLSVSPTRRPLESIAVK